MASGSIKNRVVVRKGKGGMSETGAAAKLLIHSAAHVRELLHCSPPRTSATIPAATNRMFSTLLQAPSGPHLPELCGCIIHSSLPGGERGLKLQELSIPKNTVIAGREFHAASREKRDVRSGGRWFTLSSPHKPHRQQAVQTDGEGTCSFHAQEKNAMSYSGSGCNSLRPRPLMEPK